ncbi:hypothetical protein B0I35DRAFT_61384 [Stachybotrys elegans]|uniref:Secreted protein n=1 Tax=Stachybotrys elegans TaxID=80388 RepID=A0A8K0WNQ5_9HYPO|nr:hypothetical protein B0I35DRAFT_61384 [Stachybotrys elegans]
MLVALVFQVSFPCLLGVRIGPGTVRWGFVVVDSHHRLTMTLELDSGCGRRVCELLGGFSCSFSDTSAIEPVADFLTSSAIACSISWQEERMGPSMVSFCPLQSLRRR